MAPISIALLNCHLKERRDVEDGVDRLSRGICHAVKADGVV